MEGYYVNNPKWYPNLRSDMIRILNNSIVALNDWSKVEDQKKSGNAKKYAKDAENYLTWITELTPEKILDIQKERQAYEDRKRQEAGAPAVGAEASVDVSQELLRYGITPQSKKLMESYGLSLTWNPWAKITDAKRKALEALGFKIWPISNTPESVVIKWKPETRKIWNQNITIDEVVYFDAKSKSFPSVSQIDIFYWKAVTISEKSVSWVEMLSLSRGQDEFLIPKDIEAARKKILNTPEKQQKPGWSNVTDLI